MPDGIRDGVIPGKGGRWESLMSGSRWGGGATGGKAAGKAVFVAVAGVIGLQVAQVRKAVDLDVQLTF